MEKKINKKASININGNKEEKKKVMGTKKKCSFSSAMLLEVIPV